MKPIVRKILKKSIILLVCSLAVMGIAYAVSFAISKNSRYGFQDIYGMAGIGIVVIGVLLALRGGNSGINFRGMGTNYGQQVTIQNLEAEKSERASGEYYKKFSQNANLGFDLINLPLIIGGIITVICSVYCVH